MRNTRGPVADLIMSVEDIDRAAFQAEMRRIKRIAFASFSKQLLAVCDERTPHRIVELARDWQAEAAE